MTTPPRTDDGAKPEFRLTGRHVLTILVSIFAIVFVVNGYMVWTAVGSHPGVVTESSYRDSQRFNSEIAAGRAQAERGWKVASHAERIADGRVHLALEALDAKGAALPGVTFKARLEHPANRAFDHHVAFAPIDAAGRYEAFVADVPAGKWTLVIEGDGAEGRLFLSNSAIMLR